MNFAEFRTVGTRGGGGRGGGEIGKGTDKSSWEGGIGIGGTAVGDETGIGGGAKETCEEEGREEEKMKSSHLI